MKQSRFAVFIALASLCGSLWAISGTSAHAAMTAEAAGGQATQTSTCAITPADLAAIKTAQASGLKDELAARKALLVRIIGCAKSDAQNLEAQLKGISAPDDTKSFQSQLAGKLEDSANYYDIELSKVNDAGVFGTQNIAREVLAWRAASYDPVAAQVSNFTLWAENQPLFGTASDRLGQMRNIVNFLERAAQNTELENSFGTAEALVTKANTENQAAKDAILQGSPADETFGLIKQSLASLTDAYKKFFDVSNIAQSLLSTKPQ